MHRRMLAAAIAGGLSVLGLIPASALADGGQSIASAPTIIFGQQEFGSTATGAFLTFGCGPGYRSFWAMPVLAGDQVTIGWESPVPTTEMVVAPVGTTDANMAYSDNLVEQALVGNKNSFAFTAPATGTIPMWFRSCEDSGAVPGAYFFTATDQHAVVVQLQARRYIRRRAVVRAAAEMANGAPVPNGLRFFLTAHWGFGGRKQVTAVSSGGRLRFPITFPRRTIGRHVSLRVSRPDDPQFLHARSPRLSVVVAQPRPHRLVCRRGFKKRRTHGRERCVKFQATVP